MCFNSLLGWRPSLLGGEQASKNEYKELEDRTTCFAARVLRSSTARMKYWWLAEAKIRTGTENIETFDLIRL